MKISVRCLSISLALAGLACAPTAEVPARVASTTSQALTLQNGDNLNGDNLNGDNLNGDNLNGDNLNGTGLGGHLVSVNYAGASLTSGSLDRSWVAGSQLTGQNGSGVHRGQDFVGAHFNGTSDTGATVQLTIAHVTQEASPNTDSWDYEVWYSDPVHNASWPLCRDANGNAVSAYALDGHWSYAQGVSGGGAKIVDGTTFTFACKGQGAIGKCVSPIGYKPWGSYNGTSLNLQHQACVRLIRADYCGDGTSHTVDGKWVDLYDNLGLQSDTESWNFEAEWDQNGARCVTSTLRGGTSFSCYAAKYSGTCGSLGDFNAGTLLMDEIPPSP
jgi:hypothetical protein